MQQEKEGWNQWFFEREQRMDMKETEEMRTDLRSMSMIPSRLLMHLPGQCLTNALPALHIIQCGQARQ